MSEDGSLAEAAAIRTEGPVFNRFPSRVCPVQEARERMALPQPYLPVAVVTRLADGQLVVLNGQAGLVETSMDMDTRADGSYRTTVDWRPGTPVMRSNLPEYVPGVKLHDTNGIGGPLFHPEPTYDTAAHVMDVRPMTDDEQRAEHLTPGQRDPWLAQCSCGARMLPLLCGEANAWAQGHLGTRPTTVGE